MIETPGQLENVVKRHIRLIEQRSDRINRILVTTESGLNAAVQDAIFSRVDIKAGRVVNNQATRRALNSINAASKKYMQEAAPKIIKEVHAAVNDVLAMNQDYFAGNASAATIKQTADAIKIGVLDMLGITERGALIDGGYLSTMFNNPAVGAKITRVAYGQAVTRAPVASLKQAITAAVKGNTNTGATGIFSEVFKDTLQDVVATTDRMVTDAYADRLGLEFAIYSGNIIATTRPFCRSRAGKVFHRSEIAKFDPPTAKPPGYNPFTMLGGYNCRHRLSWISKELAIRLRPDAEKFVKAAA